MDGPDPSTQARSRGPHGADQQRSIELDDALESLRALSQRDPAEAQRALVELRQRWPDSPAPELLAARLHRRALELGASVAVLDAILQAHPDHVAAAALAAEVRPLAQRWTGPPGDPAADHVLLSALRSDAALLAAAAGGPIEPIPGRWVVAALDLLIGGHSTRAVQLARNLHAGGLDVHLLVAAGSGGPRRADAQASGIQVVSWEALGEDRTPTSDDSLLAELNMTGDLARLAAVLGALRPEVLLTTGDPILVATTAAVAVALGVPRILMSTGSMAPIERHDPAMVAMRGRHAATRVLLRHLVHEPSVGYSTSTDACLASHQRWLGPIPRPSIIRNPMSVADLRSVALTPIDRPWPVGAAVVGTACRITEVKRLDRFIEVGRRVRMVRPDVHLVIVGEGDRGLLGDVDDLDGHLHLTGWQERAEPWIAAMDVVLLTSSAEGGAGVVLEAQALGRPVVAADVGGVREGFLDGRTGVLVRDVDDVGAYVAAVLAVLDDRAIPDEARTAGPTHIDELFSDEAVHEALLAATGSTARYDEVVEGAPASPGAGTS